MICTAFSFCTMLVYCLFFAPPHQKEFLVCVNILGNKQDSDSDSDVTPRRPGRVLHLRGN